MIDQGESEKILVADNLSDDVLLVDAASGAILRRFDSEHPRICSRFLSLRSRGNAGRQERLL